MKTATNDNALLQHDRLPRFDAIRVEHVVPAVKDLVARQNAAVDALERDLASGKVKPSWASVMDHLTEVTEPLAYAWGITGHLMSVQNSPELRAAHEAVQPDVVQCSMRLAQSRAIFDAVSAIQKGPEWAKLDGPQRRIIEAHLRSARLAGVALEGPAKERFQAIELELSEHGTKFSNHLLDANKAFAMTLTREDEVDGLPPTARAGTAAAAKANGHPEATAEKGPWRITLDAPVYIPFMEHARRRDLREKLYRAFVTRAAAGDLDNAPLIDRILALRQEKAELLGYSSFAEVSLASKMAPGVDAVEKLLSELRTAAHARAKGELSELTAYARKTSGDQKLELSLWDVPFWAERLREERYAYTEEELRPYFALPRVLDGLFGLARRLFGVKIRAADGETPVWDPSVRFFRVADEEDRDIAAFYLDAYSRPANKRGGAWMNNALDRKRMAAGLRLPVAYLVCNQTPPVGDSPSLMTFQEVETLFHEFGHGLQHMLTRVDYVDAAGINNVEWDAVELPSQFMENWCFHAATVLGTPAEPGLARHFETGATLPGDLFKKIQAARVYRAATMTLRQVYLATLDLELHHRFKSKAAGSSAMPGASSMPTTVLEVQRKVAAANTILAPLVEDRFLCSFSHIFAGGYAAGYYSYKWAEVLSADAFAAFEEAGLERAEEVARTGRRFRETVLALGGGKHPMEVFESFRGRAPSTEALLRHSGLLEPAGR
ncbi:MAG: M3 family metallopeptidase [Planctomycetota bacterium]